MFSAMKAAAFDMDAPLNERRTIVRYGDDNVEMVELPWGLRPKELGGPPFNLVRGEGRTFLAIAAWCRHRSSGSSSRTTLRILACRRRLILPRWHLAACVSRLAEAYVILTVATNAEAVRYQVRQMTVLRRQQRMEWLDLARPVDELLRPLPRGAFRVERVFTAKPAAQGYEAR